MTGGSSHGSAVAMAAGLAGFTVGSDTGGSVRWPAALCGVVGYKASTTHWPRDGVFPLSPLLDSVGIFTRSVHDAAWIEAALAARALRSPPPVARLHLALPGQHFMKHLDPAVASCFDEALKRLRKAGASIVEIDVPEAAEVDAVFRSLVPADLLAFLGRERVKQQFDRLDPVAAQRIQAALTLTADDYVQMATRQQVLEHLMRERSRGIDAWITPTVPVLPQPTADFKTVEVVAAWNRLATQNTRPGNLFNQCGVSLPIQHLGADLPVGLQLCATAGADEALLQSAVAIEALIGAPAPYVLDDLLA
jgi:aspartyl-tRNA(Asn)/glutamyl-tRNA(Gln) amidotransferase subunit A